jgi:hypothetical protein
MLGEECGELFFGSAPIDILNVEFAALIQSALAMLAVGGVRDFS